ncbi:hypothetical protein ACOME3_006989 [Neoechinorhynchus agilis]
MLAIRLDCLEKLDIVLKITNKTTVAIPELNVTQGNLCMNEEPMEMTVRQILENIENAKIKDFIEGKPAEAMNLLIEDVPDESSSELRNTPTTFEMDCPNCGSDPYDNRMFEMWINQLDSEMKVISGPIREKGVRTTLIVTHQSDLLRDVLKSDHAIVIVPNIDFTMQPGSQGSRLTTIEGLLTGVYDSLRSQMATDGSRTNGCDSYVPPTNLQRLDEFLDKLKEIIDGRSLPFEFVIDDPSGTSYLQNFYAPESDPMMKIEEYTRTREQDEELGLLDDNVQSNGDQ